MPNPLGDFVMATGVLKSLHDHYPNALIQVVSPYKELLPGYDVVPVGTKLSRPFDLGILLTGSLSSAWHFFRNRIPRRLGYVKDGRRLLLNMPVRFPKTIESQHLVKTYHDLLAPLGITAINPPKLETDATLAWGVFGKFGLKEGDQIVGVNAGAAYGPAKCWPLERFAEVVRRLIEDKKRHVVLFGSPDMAETNRIIAAGLGNQVIDLCGKTSLAELAACIGALDAFLTNDSGPMHIAAALKTPLVAIFGSTSDVKTGPYQWGTVIHKRVLCSPCYRRTCPIDFRCMKRIETDEVYQEVIKCLT